MYEDHFERIEKKYLITKKQKDDLLNSISKYIDKDLFFESNIHNIYFDTINNDLIINSIEKPIFKDKYRVRSYGLPKLDDTVFLETKTKYKGVVGKRRIKLTLKEYYDYVNNNSFNEDDQIFKEIDYYFNYYHLIPKIYIAYDRTSYIGKDDKHLRITFDSNLRSRRSNLTFKEEDEMTNYFDEDIYIMEIKMVGALPLWFARILSELKIMPTSFSKYGKIYEKEVLEGRI